MNFFEGLKSIPNIHPVLVHFPIALILIAGGLFFIAVFLPKEEILITARWNFILGAGFTIITVISGIIAEKSLPHDDMIHKTMTIHENIMKVVMILSIVLCVYLLKKKDMFALLKDRIFLAGLTILLALLVVGADFGGKMVFKYGAGTELYLKVNPPAPKGESHGGHNHDHNHKH